MDLEGLRGMGWPVVGRLFASHSHTCGPYAPASCSLHFYRLPWGLPDTVSLVPMAAGGGGLGEEGLATAPHHSFLEVSPSTLPKKGCEAGVWRLCTSFNIIPRES